MLDEKGDVDDGNLADDLVKLFSRPISPKR